MKLRSSSIQLDQELHKVTLYFEKIDSMSYLMTQRNKINQFGEEFFMIYCLLHVFLSKNEFFFSKSGMEAYCQTQRLKTIIEFDEIKIPAAIYDHIYYLKLHP
jgi:hypothetical protein